jgi:ABC-type nitrate/sulfonate/bicarbonate transport system, ATPase component
MLEFASASKSFDGKTVVRSATLSLRAGEILCLTGPSGIGKTTLLELAAGVTKPDAGRVSRTVKASLMFQDDVLIPWQTAEEAITYILPDAMPERERLERAALWLETFELEGGIYPAAMSGGMRRRLSLARTFAAERPLVLLDEPFAFLDTERCRLVMAAIVRHVRNGGTVMLTSHTTEPLDVSEPDAPVVRLVSVTHSPITIS